MSEELFGRGSTSSGRLLSEDGLVWRLRRALLWLVFLPAGAALFAAAGEFVYGGPSPCFRGFRAEAPLLVAGFDVFRLTLLFVSVTGFIALRHCWLFSGFNNSPVLRRFRERHIDAQRRAQINFMFLLLHDDGAQGLAQRKFPHRFGLADALAITPHRFPFVLQIRAQHCDRIT